MPIVGDFRVVNDLPHKLTAGQQFSVAFEIPPNLCRTGEQPRSVILVKFALEGASALTWELHLNGATLFTFSGSGSNLLTTMEAFSASRLLVGENQVEVKATHGMGAVKVADIVVNYHVQI